MTPTPPAVPAAAHPRHVVGSASIWVLAQVAGARRTARVLHAGRDALYLDLEGQCLAVLGARAVQVPCGVRTRLPALPGLSPGTAVVVQDGSVELPDLEVLVTDIVDTTVPVLASDAAAAGIERLTALAEPGVASVRAQLPADALEMLAAADADAVMKLLGLGPGLTPLGDDVLAGWLATAVAARHPELAAVRSGVALNAADRTTSLSATLLACAARGEAVPEFRSLVHGLATGNDAVVDQSLALLLRIGDTSGAGLVLGTLLALDPSAANRRNPA